MNTEFWSEALPGSGVLLLEGSGGDAHRVLALSLAGILASAGKRVLYLTPGFGEDVADLVEVYRIPAGKVQVMDRLPQPGAILKVKGDLLAVDHFSLLFMDRDLTEMKNLLAELHVVSRGGTLVLLLADEGTLPPSHRHALREMVDGVVEFQAVREGDRIRRYIHIPKMAGKLPLDRLVPFTLSVEGITIDPRERYR